MVQWSTLLFVDRILNFDVFPEKFESLGNFLNYSLFIINK